MLKRLINTQNEDLWKLLDNHFNISILKKRNVDYSVFSKDNNIEITIDSNNLSAASFTHELLHVNMRYHNCYIGASLKNNITSNDELSQLISDDLLEHIGNSLDHVKFLPQYLNLGFNRNDFISDYNIHKCNEEQLKLISNKYLKSDKINSNLVDLYIGILVAMIADPNPKLDYSKELILFEKIDPKLFYCVLKLFKDWEKVNIESSDIMDYGYHEVIFEFIEGIEDWYDLSNFK